MDAPRRDLVPCHAWCCTYRLQWGYWRTYYLKKWGTTGLQRKSAKKMDVKCSQLREVTDRWELRVQELEPEGLTFKSDSVVLAYIKNEGELKQLHLRKVLSLWWGQGDCTVSSRQLSVGSWSHIVLLPAACSKTGWQWKWNLLQILSQHDPGSSQQTSIRMFASACDWVTSLL